MGLECGVGVPVWAQRRDEPTCCPAHHPRREPRVAAWPRHGVRPPHSSVNALLPLSVLLRPQGADCLSLPTELKKQVESAELKNQRLKEVFQTKIQEFRKVCYTLTGYQVDITTENQYRLTSMYAEQKADCLIFKVGRSAPRAPGPSLPSPSASAPLGGRGAGLRVIVPSGG